MEKLKISIDKVRLSFISQNDNVSRWVQSYWDKNKTQGEYRESFRFFDYRHLWTFPCEESSVSIMYGLNSDKSDGRFSGALEWNPNKVNLSNSGELWLMIKHLLMFAKSFVLVTADVAFDIKGVRISQCLLERGLKSCLRYHMGRTEAMTIYAGARGSAGSVKVYDKQRELIETGHSDVGLLTRYEMTLRSDVSFVRIGGKTSFVGGLKPCSVPSLIVIGELSLVEEITPEMLLILEGLHTKPHLFQLLSKYQRAKIKALQCCNTITPDLADAETMMKSWFVDFYNTIIA